jgi:transcriptional regulator with XRE-family HTH domain
MKSNDGVPARITPEGKLFGETLKRLRTERGLSQEKLANHQRLGSKPMTTNYVSDLERGVKAPSLITILKLAHALGIPPADLLADFTPAMLKRLFRN